MLAIKITHRITVVLLAFLFGLLVLFGTKPATAQDIVEQDFVQFLNSSCVPDKNPVGSLAVPSDGSYDVFVKFGQNIESGAVALYYLSFNDSQCQLIGNLAGLNNNWELAGEFAVNDSFGGQFLLYFDQDIDHSFAGDAQIALFDQKNPVCNIALNDCFVEFANTQVELLPKRLTSRSDAVQVFQYKNPFDAGVVEVIYAVNSKPVYRKSTFEDFNLRYVPGGEQTLQRIIMLSDGQRLLAVEQVERGIEADPVYIFVSTISRQGRVLSIICFVISIIVGFFVILFLLKLLYRRKMWREAHVAKYGALPNSDNLQQQVAHIQPHNEWLGALSYYKKPFISMIAIFGILVFVQSNVLGLFTTDGASMSPTLMDGQRLVVNRVPVNISKINSGNFTPNRGDIVVFTMKSTDIFSDSLADDSFIVKRVIALPGERVRIFDGTIRVYNQQNPDGFVPDNEGEWRDVIEPSDGVLIDVELGVGELFVAGDNRNGSYDSRQHGPVNAEDVVGVLVRAL